MLSVAFGALGYAPKWMRKSAYGYAVLSIGCLISVGFAIVFSMRFGAYGDAPCGIWCIGLCSKVDAEKCIWVCGFEHMVMLLIALGYALKRIHNITCFYIILVVDE